MVLAGTRRWVSQPISRLREGITRMAQGDLDTRIAIKGRDELSELAHSFNRMAADLKIARERIIRDAEGRLELESGLRQSEKLATVGQLASGLAHEIGTPLNILLGRTELIKRRLEDKESIQRNLEIIDSQIERITKIIQQLLGFVRKKKPEQKVLDIGAILETTLDLLDYRIEKQKTRGGERFRGRSASRAGRSGFASAGLPEPHPQCDRIDARRGNAPPPHLIRPCFQGGPSGKRETLYRGAGGGYGRGDGRRGHPAHIQGLLYDEGRQGRGWGSWSPRALSRTMTDGSMSRARQERDRSLRSTSLLFAEAGEA